MTPTFIGDFNDPRLDPYRDIKQPSKTRWARRVIAEGWRVTELLLRSDLTVESVLISERRLGSIGSIVPAGVPLLVVSQEMAERLVGFNFHAGVLAAAERPPKCTFDQWTNRFGAAETVVAFPRVADPENVGLIMRTAAAFGVRHMLIGSQSASPYSRRSLRLSMGGVFQLSLFESSQFEVHLRQLGGAHGFLLVAGDCEPHARAVDQLTVPERACLVLGHESQGLDAQIAAICHDQVTIPMSAAVDSLNVSTAAGVILYEWNRQRRARTANSGESADR